MKAFAISFSALFLVSGLAFADTVVTGKLQTNDTATVVLVYAEYEYQGSNKLCMNMTFTDSGFKFLPVVSQRLINVGNGDLNTKIPDKVKIKLNQCTLERKAKLKVAVGKTKLFENIIKMGGKKISASTYEFKGSVPGVDVEEATSSVNKMTCSYPEGKIVATCNANLVTVDANGNLNLDIVVQ